MKELYESELSRRSTCGQIIILSKKVEVYISITNSIGLCNIDK